MSHTRNPSFSSNGLAKNVFPVPGGPTKRQPLGILAPRAVYLSGFFKKSTILQLVGTSNVGESDSGVSNLLEFRFGMTKIRGTADPARSTRATLGSAIQEEQSNKDEEREQQIPNEMKRPFPESPSEMEKSTSFMASMFMGSESLQASAVEQRCALDVVGLDFRAMSYFELEMHGIGLGFRARLITF